MRAARHMTTAIAFGAALAITACAKAPADTGFMAEAGFAPGSQQDLAQNAGDRVFFESDSSDLTPKAQATLDRQVAWLRRNDHGPFLIQGNADERGTREYNFALGQRRAEAVKDYLAARGIPAGRIRTISYGKERPVAVCNDISCWSQNRRAETHVDAGQS